MKKVYKIITIVIVTAFIIIGGLSALHTYAKNDQQEKRDLAIEVPVSALYIENGTTVAGITKTWFRANCSSHDSTNPAYLKIKIPDSVTLIGKSAFYTGKANRDDNDAYQYIHPSNYKIISIDFTEANSLDRIDNQAFLGNDQLSGTVTFPQSLKTLGTNAFGDCSRLEEIYLSKNLEEIGKQDSGSVFKNCSSLKFVRTKERYSEDVIDLPETLKTIGTSAFEGAFKNAQKSSIIIPETVTYIGNKAFDNPAVMKITVKSNDVIGYHGGAFTSSELDYGLEGRMTIFNDYETYNQFTPNGFQIYKNSLTYEFTLQFGADGKKEKRLNNQSVQCVKNEKNQWYLDKDYQLPEVTGIHIKDGYVGKWLYLGQVLSTDKILKSNADTLILQAGIALADPIIDYVVDEKVINVEREYPELNVSYDKEHKIGIKVQHPLEGAGNENGYVKFQYKWTDIWKNGTKGPRNNESAFQQIGNQSAISIDGTKDERTLTGKYSNEDYERGYYLVEIYAYYVDRKTGLEHLFYKSSSTAIDSDTQRTTDRQYYFDVITSSPVQKPDIVVQTDNVRYGYDNAKINATVSDVAGQKNSYQWYKVDCKGQKENGEMIAGATQPTLTLEKGKEVGDYHYYFEVTSIKTLNNDVMKTTVPITFSVIKAKNRWKEKLDINDWIYGEDIHAPKSKAQFGIPTYTYSQAENGYYTSEVPTHAGTWYVKSTIYDTKNYDGLEDIKTFVIQKAIPNYTIPQDITAIYGQKYKDIQLPDGFEWMDENQDVGNLGNHIARVRYTPNDIQNYIIVDNIEIHLTVIEAKEPSLSFQEKSPDTNDSTISNLWFKMIIISCGFIFFIMKKDKQKNH